MAQDTGEDWFTRLQKKMATQPKSTPDEVAAFAAERKANENTIWDWAQMQQNGDIAVRITNYGENGQHGTGEFAVRPDNKDYEKCRTEYGLEVPGDTRHIKKRLIDGAWIVEINEKTNSNPSHLNPSAAKGKLAKQ